MLFSIPASEKPGLDAAEGKGFGYIGCEVQVTLPSGEQIGATTYTAQPKWIKPALPVYTWYKDFVTDGATEHGLDSAYVNKAIASIAAVIDPKPGRERKERAKVC